MLHLLSGLDTGDLPTVSPNPAPSHYQGSLPQQGSREHREGILDLEAGQDPSPYRKGPSQWKNQSHAHLQSRLAQEQNPDHMDGTVVPSQDPHASPPEGTPAPEPRHRQQSILIFRHTPDRGATIIKTAGEQPLPGEPPSSAMSY